MKDKELFNLLREEKLIKEEIGQKLLREARASAKSLEDLIYERNLIPEQKIAEVKSRYLGVPYKKFNLEEIEPRLLKIISEDTSRTYKVVPIKIEGDTLIVGMLNPDDTRAQNALKFIARREDLNLGVYLITPSDLEKVWRKYSPYQTEIEKALQVIGEIKAPSTQKVVELEKAISAEEEAPIIKIVASTLKEAVEVQASDIHIEPQQNYLRIRFRIDGKLKQVSSLPSELHRPIISRIKVLSNLKLDETRIPQDGRFRTVIYGKHIDFRVATFPTPLGEKVAIRILDPTVGLKGLYELGLEGPNLEATLEALSKPYGMILISGPTGSGKTTSLYALLQKLNQEEVNVVSLEDPVEYFIEGISQSQIKEDIGYSFASGLRQVVRQDPDVIMVGEIRDEETAGLAIQAALTGHILLSTIHTNDAVGVIPRLLDLKVRPFLLPSSLILMLAQRLVARICPFCKKEVQVSEQVQDIIEQELNNLPEKIKSEILGKYQRPYVLYKGTGCPKCMGKGLKGRIGIFEVLKMTSQLASIIEQGFSREKAEQEAKRQGMITLRQDGIIKALRGETTIEEVLRQTI